MSETAVPSAVSTDSAPTDLSLRHVMLVAGTLNEWAAFGDDRWAARADELGNYLTSIGVPWLTVRPYTIGSVDVADVAAGLTRTVRASAQAGGCTVIVDPSADGRRRFAAAMQSLPLDDEVNEATVSAALYEPADSEPDLVVVLGRSDQLPPSLVWEIAYAELYFADIGWQALTSAVLERAVGGFADRRRRFGGLPGVTDDDSTNSDGNGYRSDDYDSDDYQSDDYDGDDYDSDDYSNDRGARADE